MSIKRLDKKAGVMRDKDHPPVYFRKEGDRDWSQGFLAIIDGAPWLAGSLDEARSRVPATMFRLVPEHLQEMRDSETGEQIFRYRHTLPIR